MLMSIPMAPELDTEGGRILHDMVQLLNYVMVAPTLSRQELATELLGVATKVMGTLSNQKVQIQSLGKQLTDANEQLENAKASERSEHHPEELLQPEHLPEELLHEHLPEEILQPEHLSEEILQPEHLSEEILQPEHLPEEFLHPEHLPEPSVQVEDNKDVCSPTEPQVDVTLERIKTGKETIWSSTSEYVVECVLGSGAFGTVVQCMKKPSCDTVALKLIKDNHHIGEVEVLTTLKALDADQFNVVSCSDAFIYKGLLCIEFQKLDVSLEDYLQAHGPLQPNEIRPVLQQMAVALSLLRDNGMIHTDLKPHNIMLADRFRQPLKVKLIDFGEVMHQPERYVGRTFQTLVFRSPEVVLGNLCSGAIDVWSLGCIAAGMLTGTLLLDVWSDAELMDWIVSVLGQPPDHMLEQGMHSDKYFSKTSSSDTTQGWVLKPSDRPARPNGKLHDLLKVAARIQAEDQQAVWCDWLCFMDLVEKMLRMDPSKRIAPEAILFHPFITMRHLDHPSYNSYVKSSIDCMKVCNHWSYDGAQDVRQPIPNTSSTSGSDSNSLTVEHRLNSEEELSGPEVSVGGEKGSPKRFSSEEDKISCSARGICVAGSSSPLSFLT